MDDASANPEGSQPPRAAEPLTDLTTPTPPATAARINDSGLEACPHDPPSSPLPRVLVQPKAPHVGPAATPPSNHPDSTIPQPSKHADPRQGNVHSQHPPPGGIAMDWEPLAGEPRPGPASATQTPTAAPNPFVIDAADRANLTAKQVTRQFVTQSEAIAAIGPIPMG